jgi:hypothetical protein
LRVYSTLPETGNIALLAPATELGDLRPGTILADGRQQNFHGINLPILLYTGNDLTGEDAQMAGAGYQTKPSGT